MNIAQSVSIQIASMPDGKDSDLITLAEGLIDGKLLNPELQKKRMDSLVPVDADNPGAALYGMALAQFGPLYGHTGELPGYNTFMGRDPKNKVTLVVWTNLAPAPDGRDPASTIAKAIIGDLYGEAPSGPSTPSTSDTATPGG